jgi:hypothetical protein
MDSALKIQRKKAAMHLRCQLEAGRERKDPCKTCGSIYNVRPHWVNAFSVDNVDWYCLAHIPPQSMD